MSTIYAPGAGPPCLICNHACRPRSYVKRPFFPLPQPSAERQEAVAAWLAYTPPASTICLSHMRHLSFGNAVRQTASALRVWTTEQWFAYFGHPLHGLGRKLWRPAVRTPLEPAAVSAIPPTEDRREVLGRSSERRRKARRKAHKQLRRLAYLYQKFAHRGARRYRN